MGSVFNTEEHEDETFTFEFDLRARRNYFTLYLGSIITALFLVIFLVAFVKRRTFPVVIQLAKPDTDAHVHEYILHTRTSILCGAGLTEGARVAVQLVGSFCDSKRYTITQQFMQQKILNRCHEDIFVLYTPMDIGEVRGVRFTLFNFTSKARAYWKPCFIQVIKSTTNERWAVHVQKCIQGTHITTVYFPLTKGAREIKSFLKLVMTHHLWTSPFFTAHRFGAYTAFTNILFFFFLQSTLLLSTLASFIMSHEFLSQLSSRSLCDVIPFVCLTSVLHATLLQQIELMLLSTRPSPSQHSVKHWRGLWRNDYPPNLMQCNVQYDWDRPPEQYRHCIKLTKKAYAGKLEPGEQLGKPNIEITLAMGEIIYKGDRTVLGTTMRKLTTSSPRASCQFCLWVKHLTIRGDDLYNYTLSLSHQIRRAIQALRVSKSPNMGTRVLCVCIHQWLSSLCTRMLKEAVVRIEKEKMDKGGLQLLVDNLMALGGNLWFSEVGHKDGPLTGKKKGDNSHIISNLYFSVMRHLVGSWKSSDKGMRSILKRPNQELFPNQGKKRQLTWETKVYKKSIARIADIMNIIASQEQLKAAQGMSTSVSGTVIPEPQAAAGSSGRNTNHSALEQSTQNRIYAECNQDNTTMAQTHSSNRTNNSVRKHKQKQYHVSPQTKNQGWSQGVHHGFSQAEHRGLSEIEHQGLPQAEHQELSETEHQQLLEAEPQGLLGAENRRLPHAVHQKSIETQWDGDQKSSIIMSQFQPQTVYPEDHTELQIALGEGLVRAQNQPLFQEDDRNKTVPGVVSPRLSERDDRSSNNLSAEVGERDMCNSAVYPVTTDSDHDSETPVDTLSFSEDNAQHNSHGISVSNMGERQIHYPVNSTNPLTYVTNAASVKREGENIEVSRHFGTRASQRSPLPRQEARSKDQSYSHNLNQSAEGNSSVGKGEEKLGDDIMRRMSVQVRNFFKKKIRRFKEAHPSTILKLCERYESYANVVQLEVQAPFGTDSCYCCIKPLCQAYAVTFSQLKAFAYKIIYYIMAHNIVRRSHQHQDNAVLMRQYKMIVLAITQYTVDHAQMLQKLGHSQNQQALERLKKEVKPTDRQDQDAVSSYSYGSINSLDRSANNPLTPSDSEKWSMPNGKRSRGKGVRVQYSAFEFKQKSDRGVVNDWTHLPFPFTETLLPPLRLSWNAEESSSASVIGKRTELQPESLAGVPTNELSVIRFSSGPSICDSGVDMTSSQPAPHAAPETRDSKALSAAADDKKPLDNERSQHSGTGGTIPKNSQDGFLQLEPIVEQRINRHNLLNEVFDKALKELQEEVEWTLGLKESLAAVVAMARLDVYQELRDPLRIAVRHFTHALLVLFFEALLPKEDEEDFVVTADDIRQRRKRVSSQRTPGLFDLTDNSNPGYNLNFLDFIVVKLCERWEMAKVEFQYQPTLFFLTRCLTMANLDTDMMERLDDLVLNKPPGVPVTGLLLDRLTHVHETQHALAVVVNEVMAMTLAYVVPETLKAMTDVTGWLRNEEERVTYVCEKVAVLEYQVRHKLWRRVQQVASLQVQDQMVRFADRMEKIATRPVKMMNRLRQFVKEDYYYTLLSSEELAPIKQELREAREMAHVIHRVHTFQHARTVRKFTKRTRILQDQMVSDTLGALTDTRTKETEYTLRHMAEVEWVVTEQMKKGLPSVFMNIVMTVMFLGTLACLVLVTVLGASLTPHKVGEWFLMHIISLALISLFCEPFKCLWYMDFGWEQPT